MGKWIRRILMIILLVVFLVSGGSIAYTLMQYHISAELYSTLADSFTATAAAVPEDSELICAPIVVDFDALCADNPDVVGWIYCEDTVINYPVMQGDDNDLYLHHSYDGAYSTSGSIFVDASNRPGFVDANNILYGHHMKNGSMFASLDYWADQSYYEEHPVMWLLTPDGDYRIDLVAGYTTSAYSDVYTIYTGPGQAFTEYLATAVAQSDFTSNVQADENANYVVMSTCAYVFTNARYVIHGMLVPVDSTGGVLPE